MILLCKSGRQMIFMLHVPSVEGLLIVMVIVVFALIRRAGCHCTKGQMASPTNNSESKQVRAAHKARIELPAFGGP